MLGVGGGGEVLARGGACRRVHPSMIYLLFISIFCNVYVEVIMLLSCKHGLKTETRKLCFY